MTRQGCSQKRISGEGISNYYNTSNEMNHDVFSGRKGTKVSGFLKFLYGSYALRQDDIGLIKLLF